MTSSDPSETTCQTYSPLNGRRWSGSKGNADNLCHDHYQGFNAIQYILLSMGIGYYINRCLAQISNRLLGEFESVRRLQRMSSSNFDC